MADDPRACHTAAPPAESENAAELAESLKHSVLDIAEDLLAEGGGSHEKGYLYGVLTHFGAVISEAARRRLRQSHI